MLNETDRKSVQKCALKALCEFDRLCKIHHINYSLAYGTLIGAIRHKGFIPWDDDIDVCVRRSDLLRLRSFANSELNSGFFYQTHTTDKNWYRLYDKIRIDGTVFREIAHEKEDIHQGVYIDIFPLDKIPESEACAKCQLLLYKVISSLLSSKYLSLNHRQGYKKVIAIVLKIFLFPIKKEWLFNLSEKIACFAVGGKHLVSFESAYHEMIPETIFQNFINVNFEQYSFSSVSNYDFWLKLIYGDYMKLPPKDKRVTTHALSEFNINK